VPRVTFADDKRAECEVAICSRVLTGFGARAKAVSDSDIQRKQGRRVRAALLAGAFFQAARSPYCTSRATAPDEASSFHMRCRPLAASNLLQVSRINGTAYEAANLFGWNKILREVLRTRFRSAREFDAYDAE